MADSGPATASATEFWQLFEVGLPDAFLDSSFLTVSQKNKPYEATSPVSHGHRSNHLLKGGGHGHKLPKAVRAAKKDAVEENKWTCTAQSTAVPGIFLGHSSGQAWHWHAAAVPAQPDITDQGGFLDSATIMRQTLINRHLNDPRLSSEEDHAWMLKHDLM